MPSRRKVVFFTTQLGNGGAEMHLLRILNAADLENYEIHLVLARSGGNYEQFLKPEIRVHYLTRSVRSSTLSMIFSIRKLRKVIKQIQPEAIFSIMDISNLVMLKSLKNVSSVKKIICVQVDPIRNYSRKRLGRWLLSQIPGVYPSADKIVCLSEGVRSALGTLVEVDAEKMKVIHNAGIDGLRDDLSKGDGTHLVAVGRLTEQKGFDVLLEALHLVLEHHKVKLTILGEGPLRASLEDQANQLGIAENIEMLGFLDDPFPEYQKADIFILSSRWEGFGNVIVEAMASGAAVVSTDCPYGPSEIIEDGINGLLVPVEDADALAGAIKKLLEQPDLLSELKKAGLERSGDFAPQSISKQYFDLLN